MPEWDDDEEDTNLVKQLRKQLKDMTAAKTELDKEVGMLRPQVRKTTVASVLSEMGMNTKIAALLPDSVDPSKEAVSEWLKDYGDLFNIKAPEEKPPEKEAAPAEPLAGQKEVIDQSTQDQWMRMQSSESAAGVTVPDIEKQQTALLGRAVSASGGDFDSFVALLRGDKPLPQ